MLTKSSASPAWRTAWQFDSANQQVAEQDASPTDGSNNQTFVRATASGPVTSVVLDTAGDPIAELDAAGNETDNVFDTNGDLISTTGPAPTPGALRPTTTYAYNGDQQITSERNALGQTVLLIYNEFGEKVEEIDPSPSNPTAPVNPLDPPADAPIQRWGYDPDGNLVSYVSAMGVSTFYKYNNRNERVEEDDPSPDGGVTPGPVWHWVYDTAQELTEEIDPMQRVTQWVHDGDGNITQTIAPNLSTGGPGDASTTTFDTYDLDGENTSETPPLPMGASGSTTTTWQYDGLGDVTQETGPAPAPGQPAPVTQWFYNADQEVTSEIDPLGRTQTTTLDGLGRTTATTGFDGVSQQFGYDLLSNLITTTDASGTVTNTFDALGREIKTVDQNNGVTQMGYDLLGNMTSLVDSAGNHTSWQLDGLNRVVSDTNQLGASDTYQYNANGAVTQEVDRDGHVRSFQYNDLGQQTAENWLTAAGGAAVTVSYKTQGSGGHLDSYDGISFPPGVTSGTWVLTFEGQSTETLPWTATAAQVQTALAGLSAIGQGNVDVTGASGSFFVHFEGALDGTDVASQLSATSWLAYNGQLISVYEESHGGPGQDEDQLVTTQGVVGGTFTLSFEGNTTTPLNYNATPGDVQNALQALPSIGPNDVSVSGRPGAWQVLFWNNLANAPEPLLYANGSSLIGGVAVSYNQTGSSGPDTVQSIAVTATNGTFTLSFGGDTTPAIPYGASSSVIWTNLNALSSIIDTQSDGDNGSVTVSGTGTSSNPYLVTFVGLWSGTDVPLLTADSSQLFDAVRTIAQTYNADGEIIAASDVALVGGTISQYAYTYDGQGNVSSVDNAGTPEVPDVVLASAYDAAGNRASLSATITGAKDFLNSYSYNTLSELTMLQQTQQTGGNTVAGKELDYAYNAIGLVASRAAYTFLGTGPRTDVADGAYSYTTKGLLSSLIYTSHTGQVAIDSLGYTHDPLARVSTFTTIDGTATYGYDPTSQLTSASYVAASGGHEPANLSVSFDPNGNRTSTNGTSSTVGADNHISSDGTFNFTFDAEGNLSTRIRISSDPADDYKTVYLWDYRNRLTDVEFYNNSGTLTQHVHYVYDVWDHLIERDLDPNGSGTYTQIVHYVWDVAQPPSTVGGIVLAFNGSQQLIARYVNGPNTSAFDQYYSTLAEEDVTSLTSAGPTTFDLPDPQGSVTDIADSSGNPADHAVYAAFGQLAYESNPSVTHLASYAGGILDPATGQIIYINRWLDPASGRWDSQDPEGFPAGDTNLSRYVANDPTNLIDPSGLAWWSRSPDHHLVPYSVFASGKNLIAGFKEDVKEIFNNNVFDVIYDHGNDTWGDVTHPSYTKAVREELLQWMKSLGITPADLKPAQAQAFIKTILSGECPTGGDSENWKIIRGYLKGMADSNIIAAAAANAAEGKVANKADLKKLARLADKTGSNGKLLASDLASPEAKAFYEKWIKSGLYRRAAIKGALKALPPALLLIAAGKCANAFASDGIAGASRAAADELFMANLIEELATTALAPAGQYFDNTLETGQSNVLLKHRLRNPAIGEIDRINMRRALYGDPGYQGPGSGNN